MDYVERTGGAALDSFAPGALPDELDVNNVRQLCERFEHAYADGANRVTLAKLDEFAHDLHDYFATGARVGAAATVRVPAPRPQGGAAPAKA